MRSSTPNRHLPSHTGGLLVPAAVFAATALVDLIGQPTMDTPNNHIQGLADYAFTAMLLPFAAAAVVVAWWLRSQAPDRRLARFGIRLVIGGAAGFWACGIGSLATANSRFGGPLYPAAMLASLAGMALLAVASAQNRTVPRWTALALPIAWIVGGPIGEGQFFRGAALILAAVVAGIPLARRPTHAPDTVVRRQAQVA